MMTNHHFTYEPFLGDDAAADDVDKGRTPMAAREADGALAAALDGWRPSTVETTRRVDAWASAAFAALLDTAPPAETTVLPPLWHWFTLLEHPAQAEIGADGHPADGPFLPPIPGRRRMFAGGRFDQWAPIPFGCELAARSSVANVVVKSGRSGEMAFVTVRSELSADGRAVAAEEQDIVYRSEPDGAPARTVARPPGGEPAPAGEWRAGLATDPVLLARFSALTYNGHRIHYDLPYATGVEGYPDLVVHGPLLVLLALELPRRHAPDRVVEHVSYRLVRPAFVPSTVTAAGAVAGGELAAVVAAEGAAPSLTASIRFAP
jgi:3-methylfumaryl-CoA hydratase